ncbi:extracellular receptor, putative [Bodo saltans]|uniref:Extracellular receptor, putative n=1 Tax=Bodo saltans TaxID=75058 RepID=A0A0S4ITA9_BODSA|nr:extracellular receptor, putative [Bodo saltans]|eukprot:CUF74564.1 extracellular receptor, putative [Bodo saltans]
MCDYATSPETVCIVPRDYFNVRAALQITSLKLGWASAAVVLSNNDYGTGVATGLASEILSATSGPTIVTQAIIPRLKTSNATDDAFVKALLKYNPVGILAWVSDAELTRLRQAAVRVGLTTSQIFFIGSREALNIVSTMTGAKLAQTTTPLWGALITPEFTPMETWVTSGLVPANTMDQMGAFILSYLMDAMQLVMNARSSNITRIRYATVVGGYTGTVSLDAVSFQRASVIFRLISASYDITRALVTWSVTSLGATPVIDISTTSISSIIQPSPLLAVTVCMTAPSTCVDVANVNALLFYFENLNNNRASNTSVSYIPLPVYTGSSGVEGLSNLIPVARSCTFLTGPGRSTVASALTPVINEFSIPQLDYSTASGVFSNLLMYPYFSRTLPLETFLYGALFFFYEFSIPQLDYSTASGVFSNLLMYPYFSRTLPLETFLYGALGEAASYFGWERVILISTDDAYGVESTTAAQSACDDKTILVEASYAVSDTTNATLAGVFQDILNVAISRVIIFLIPLQGTDAANFFTLVNLMGMNNPSTQYLFFLSNDLCQYALSYPAARQNITNSICMTPWVNPTTYNVTQSAYLTSGMQSTLSSTLYSGGFTTVGSCDLSQISTYSAFALDTGAVITDVITRAQKAKILLTNTAALLPLVRTTSITTASGSFSINANGDRDYAAYNMNIQTASGLVVFAKWDTKTYPNFVYNTSASIVWYDNTTDIPSSTYRSISFITKSTISTNPGTIVLSVLGFVGTIAVFFFCYRHYKMQRLIELSLETGEMTPTTKNYRESAY